MWTKKNPFLRGPYEPLYTEYKVNELHVEGSIPRELKGTLYWVASNQQFEPLNPDKFHWFDGDGMVHAFRLEDGKASYSNRFVETEGLKVERGAGKALYNGIMGYSNTPQPPLPEGAPRIKATANFNVIRLGDKLLAMHEVEHHYWELDPVTLETLGTFNFNGQVEGMLTAHPHFDSVTKEWIFYALDNENHFVECFSTDVDGTITARHRVPLSFTPWNHDVIFTRQHYIFFFGLISWRPWSDELIQKGKSSWFVAPDQDRNARILFVDRKTGEAIWLHPENSEYMIGHFLNAYQDEGDTIIDASTTPVSNAILQFNPSDYYPFPLVDGPSAFEQPQLWRFVINLRQGTVRHHRIGDFSAEFVRPNETILGSPHRYGYMAGVHDPKPESRGFNCLIKHDYQTGTTEFQHVTRELDLVVGEPIFVPHPEAKEEDHGWILAVWYHPLRNASELVILDATDFSGKPVARIKLDHHVPQGFHGNWIADR